MIEIPPRFAGQPPVNPDAQDALTRGQIWKGTAGLAEDVRYYGEWMRDEARKRIGHLYPKVKLPKEHGGGEATVIAWLWARTVKCPNPACGAWMPLANSFWLSKKKGKKVWIEPIVDKAEKTVRFRVQRGNGMPPEPTKVGRGARFRCLVCHQDSPEQHVKSESMAGRMGAQLMAIVAEEQRGRIYLPPSEKHVKIAESAKPNWIPDAEMNRETTNLVSGRGYGFFIWADLFTSRQLTALTTFTNLVSEARKQVEKDAAKARSRNVADYADAVATYLSLGVSRLSDICNSLCAWENTKTQVRNLFKRQAIPMLWDFAEPNVFAEAAGDFGVSLGNLVKALEKMPAQNEGFTRQLDAASAFSDVEAPLISTDPPYYDNIGYADLSDFFYIWLRRNLGKIYPNLFGRILVPKVEELVAARYRFSGDKAKAEEHFLTGLGKAFHLMWNRAHPDYPMTVYYAFKQSETDKEDGGVASTGWETMLEGLLKAGFQITGTLPMRTELSNRPIASGTNALASSIVLVCRPRPNDRNTAIRRDLISALRRELPDALRHLQEGNIAPVDLAQAAIGPGMAVFSRYSNILEANGTPMRVRTALQIINSELDAYFAEQEGDFDPDTRFCTAWFEQHCMEGGAFGEADVLARAKNSSVEGIAESGILQASAGKVRLLSRDEYPNDWDPTSDSRLNTWKCTQSLIRTLDQGGEVEAARLVNLLGGGPSEAARGLAYRLYAICERKGWAQEAVPYNTLVTSWSYIQSATASSEAAPPQPDLF